MLSLYVKARNLMASDKGATAVEYGIMVAAIAAVIVAIVFLIGDEIQAAFQTVLTELQAN
jgi:pilus assembly protein Flp/PilA